jgi:hypothetical protein
MASGSRQKTTMAKLTRERALRERRELKQARKAARKLAAAQPAPESEAAVADPHDEEPSRDDGPSGA